MGGTKAGSVSVQDGSQIPHYDGRGPVVAWLWEVPGAGKNAHGVSGSLGRAQFRAEGCLKAGLTAVVESALVVYDLSTRQDSYKLTGRRCMGQLAGDHPVWSRLARS
jgi:hypothetical protein